MWKVASTVIVLFDDGHGFGPAVFKALWPRPDTYVTRVDYSFDFPVADMHGVDSVDRDPSCKVMQCIASDGSLKFSMLLIPNFKPPIAICVIHKLLALFTSEKQNGPPTIVFPYFIEPQRITWERSQTSSKEGLMLYGASIGPATKLSKTILDGLPKLPLTVRIPCEPLCCLFHLLQVYQLPAVLLLGTSTQRQNRCASEKEFEVLCEFGDFLAKFSGIVFDRVKIPLQWNAEALVSQEPWQALYA